MISKLTSRNIKRTVERELWACAAGRCQFSGCNKILYRSSVTQEPVHTAEKAHIYSISEKGPRGWGNSNGSSEVLNDISNLILVCHECHCKIDQDIVGSSYTVELLQRWKLEHERRVELVTGIDFDKKSHVILYGANIGKEESPINFNSCAQTMFPDWYPANRQPVQLSIRGSELRDNTSEYWQAEETSLHQSFLKKVVPLIQEDQCKHFSVFALAPQPLLIKLGTLLTDKISVETYQPHREPKGWHWQQDSFEEFSYIIEQPKEITSKVALLISLSDHVDRQRIRDILGNKVSIWELTIQNPHNDFMKSKEQLSLFRKEIRRLMVDIKQNHGQRTPLHVFPVMPVSCAVEFGRARMPKADMPWIIYDHSYKEQKFIYAIEIQGDSNEY